MRYMALIDKSRDAYGVAFPDLPGCVAMAHTVDDALGHAEAALRDWADTVEAGGNALPPARSAEELRVDPEVAAALADGAALAAVPLMRLRGHAVEARLSLDEGVVSAIDAAARLRGVSRSAIVETLARAHLLELD